MQFLKSIDRVRRPGPEGLDVGHREALIALYGQSAELEPMLYTRLIFDGLVGRYPRRNQYHAIKSQLKVRLLTAYQVTKMWRIERAAEDPDAHSAQRR